MFTIVAVVAIIVRHRRRHDDLQRDERRCAPAAARHRRRRAPLSVRAPNAGLQRGRVGIVRVLPPLARPSRTTLDGLAAWSKVDLTIAVDGEGIAVYGNIVSGNYFSVLGARPALGRFFAPDEDRTPLAQPGHRRLAFVLGTRSSAPTRSVDRPYGHGERPSLHRHRRRSTPGSAASSRRSRSTPGYRS